MKRSEALGSLVFLINAIVFLIVWMPTQIFAKSAFLPLVVVNLFAMIYLLWHQEME